jgi:hypothetical protein
MIHDYKYTELLLDLMETVERNSKTTKMTSEQKKETVILLFREIIMKQFSEDTWLLNFEPIIPTLLEFIVSISKKDIKIQLNKVKRCCFGK